MKRKIIIAGNWKMNKTPSEAGVLAAAVAEKARGAACGVVICVPYVDLFSAFDAVKGTNVGLGAENVHWEASGAFTGEISTAMLKECHADYVVIGHSERRQYFGETDETVNKRVLAALAAGFTVILCVGETESERDAGTTEAVIDRQTRKALDGVSEADMARVVIAYEPVWAIGTGKTATNEQAEEVCAFIRSLLGALYGAAIAEATTIQYGGSMNAKNAADLLAMPNIDGGLIGGASLKPDDFKVIIDAGSRAQEEKA